MVKCKGITFNMGRGEAAADLLNKKIKEEGLDVISIQEPYYKYKPPMGYKCYSMGNDSKVVTVIKGNIGKVWMNKQRSTKNCVVVIWERFQDEREVEIVNMYIEPTWGTGAIGSIFNRLKEDVGGGDRKRIIMGDLNAKHTAWGGQDTDERGEDLMEWCIVEGYKIENNREDPPTFENSRGKSWIDLVMTRGVEIRNRMVEDDATLSDHKYITFEIIRKQNKGMKGGKGRVYDTERADWKGFKMAMREHERLGRGLEEEIARFQEACARACERNIPTRKHQGNKGNEWWNNELENRRRRVRGKRKIWQEEKSPAERERKRRMFTAERNVYKREIKWAKEREIEEKLERFGADPWGEAYKWVRKTRLEMGEVNIKKEDGHYTNSAAETRDYLVQKYFPRDEKCDDDERARETRNELDEWIDGESIDMGTRIPITRKELQNVVRSMKGRKAVSQEGVPTECLKHVEEVKGELWKQLLNDCLKEGIFPKIWKKANIVWLPKSDGGLRPISLLPTLGKVFDKMIARRIMHHMERTKSFSDNQYGFREGRSTGQAVRKLVDLVKQQKAEKRHSLVVTLDLSNAFNSAWAPAIIRELRFHRVDESEIKVVDDFLRQRKIVVDGEEYDMQRGCPQGSSLGPVLWITLMEGWFRKIKELEEDGVMVQAYADDQVVVIGAKSLAGLEYKWARVWSACRDWATENKLKYNKKKTEAMLIPSGGRSDTRNPRIKMDNDAVTISGSVKYLGVTLDRKFLYIEHMADKGATLQNLAAKVFAIGRRRWGARELVLKKIYEGAIVPMMMYGAEVWGERWRDQRMVKKLRSIERPYLRAITKAYSTASTPALHVLAGCVPLEIRAGVAYRWFDRWQAEKAKGLPRPGERIHPAVDGIEMKVERTCNVAEVSVDGSRDETGRAGFGAVGVVEGRKEKWGYKVRGAKDNNVVEGTAILEGIMWAEKLRVKGVKVYTDSMVLVDEIKKGRTRKLVVLKIQKEIVEMMKQGRGVEVVWTARNSTDEMMDAHKIANRARTTGELTVEVRDADRGRMKKTIEKEEMEEWQQLWDGETRGRWTYGMCKKVNREGYRTDYKLTQILTGHGNMGGYFSRFRLREGEGVCTCSLNEVEDVDHIVLRCTKDKRTRTREVLKRRLEDRTYPPRIDELRNDEWEWMRDWADGMIESDVEWEG